MDKYNNRIGRSLWDGERLSPIEQMCINSYLQNGHEFHLYVYDSIEGIPEGCVVTGANVIIPKEDVFLDLRGIVASFSDWFRYKLLYTVRGWWVDMDNICIRFCDIEDDYCFSIEGTGGFKEINNRIIKTPKESEFLKNCLDLIEDEEYPGVRWLRYGPSFLRLVLSRYDHVQYVRDLSIFCPIYYPSSRQFLEGDPSNIPQNTLGIRLWNEMWRLGSVGKYETFHENSLIEHFNRCYVNP